MTQSVLAVSPPDPGMWLNRQWQISITTRRRSYSRAEARRATAPSAIVVSTAAEAIRFAIEVMPPDLLLGAVLEVEEERLNGHRIRELYDSTAYPFARTGNCPSSC